MRSGRSLKRGRSIARQESQCLSKKREEQRAASNERALYEEKLQQTVDPACGASNETVSLQLPANCRWVSTKFADVTWWQTPGARRCGSCLPERTTENAPEPKQVFSQKQFRILGFHFCSSPLSDLFIDSSLSPYTIQSGSRHDCTDWRCGGSDSLKSSKPQKFQSVFVFRHGRTLVQRSQNTICRLSQ